MMLTIGEWIIIGLLGLILIMTIVILIMNSKKTDQTHKFDELQTSLSNSFHQSITLLSGILTNANQQFSEQQLTKIDLLVNTLGQNFTTLQSNIHVITSKSDQSVQSLKHGVETSLTEIRDAVSKALSSNTIETEQKLENIRITLANAITQMQTENAKKLDEMRNTVDEKLQKTLEDRINKSFALVSKQLEDVYKGLGEMQTLAVGVGDLKKVLTNVKTRGILGEIQLRSILEEILAIDQYEENVITKESSADRVEFAIKLPGNDKEKVYLPVDAKFPIEDYQALQSTYDTGDIKQIKAAQTALVNKIKAFAKLINNKYIDVPKTTEFAIMFLPLESLFSEVVKTGAFEEVQRSYKVIIAGPTTMAAILNSLHMGFRTLAIQKRSSEVWQVLGAVKTEFANFGNVLDSARKKLDQANKDLDTLVGTRTRAIQRKLQTVTALPELDAQTLIGSKEEID
ncbi:MAG: DNA recombination protein RmuC [Bacilli bacterium]|nr:DNA recombination protein RmuC [Bacilli bacterium]MDD4056746.1 DNA recombination protein RmuC [Bacilli bacterium]MDY0209217.1 DNA recombination protein RmuC [Bacilli bacterium]